MRSYFTWSPNLSATLTLPKDEWKPSETGGWIGFWLLAGCDLPRSGGDVFLGWNRCAHFQKHRRGASLLCQGQSPPRICRIQMIWSLLTASIAANACPLLAPVQWQKLNHGPHMTQFLRSFGKTMIHDSQSLTPPSCLQPHPPEWCTVNKSQQKPPCDCPGLSGWVWETVTCAQDSC